MKSSCKYAGVFLAATAISFVTSGCGDTSSPTSGETAQSPDPGSEGSHAHDEDAGMPQDFASSVAAIKDCYEQIKVAFESGKPDDAHGPLHVMRDLIETAPKLVQAAGLAEEDEKAANQALGVMNEAYSSIDEAAHAGETPDYTSKSEDLDKSISELEGVVSRQTPNEES